jgi:hypothetical protein
MSGMPSRDLYQINLASIRRKLPAGYRPPASFDAFVAFCRRQRRGSLGWFRIEGYHSDDLWAGIPLAEVAPFLVLPAGGVVAWWFEKGRRTHSVVHISSEGEQAVVAGSFADFLARLAMRKTRVDDLDTQDGGIVLPAAWRRGRAPDRAVMAALRRRFTAYLKAHEPVPEQVPGALGEEIRAAVVRVVGLRGLRGDWDNHLLEVHFTQRKFDVRWYDKGLVPFPRAERLRAPLIQLRDALGRELGRTSLAVFGNGKVVLGSLMTLGAP